MSEKPAAVEFGIGERLLRRAGRWPVLTWLYAWLALTWAWLLVQMLVGMPWSSMTPKPPARNQIRYADMEGKQTQSGIVVRFSERVLAADPPISALRFGSDLQFGEHDGRVVATAQTMVPFDCGWPLPMFSGRLWSAWDVTDPERGFVPAAGIFPRPQRGIESAGIVWMSEDGAKNLRLHLQQAGVWTPVVITAVPIAPIAALWIAYQWRQRRRSARGACLECGHARGPGAISHRCSECGIVFEDPGSFADTSRLKLAIRGAWLSVAALLLWLMVTSALFVVFWFNAREHVIDEAQIRENARFRADYARQEGLISPGESGLRASERQIGWPWPIVTTERWRWYSVNFDATYVPVPVDPDIEFRDERTEWDWYAFDDDPYILNWYLIYWRPGVLVLCVSAFIAGNILCAMQRMCWARRTGTASHR